ncbi:MAG: PHP domain-containing protein [Coriobacteriia bacterium]|nr:PHP domain-containing protein [Coriobacteriia bacterium]
MKADLHVHSTVSDGSDSIDELIILAEQRGLDAIAITDHDTVSHMAQIVQLSKVGKRRSRVDESPQAPYSTGLSSLTHLFSPLSPSDSKLRVLGGVEMSSVHRPTNTGAHILGYHIVKPWLITALAQPLLEARHLNSMKQVERLQKLGYDIDVNKLARADNKYLYKQHIMDWLVNTGQALDMFGGFYQEVFKRGGPCDFDIEYIDVFDSVCAIKEAGGLAVLAHPGKQQNFLLIKELVKVGLDGIELNHHSHSAKDKSIIEQCAAEYGLFLTGGSDYHGRFEPQPFGIGDFVSHYSGVRALALDS